MSSAAQGGKITVLSSVLHTKRRRGTGEKKRKGGRRERGKRKGRKRRKESGGRESEPKRWGQGEGGGAVGGTLLDSP